MQCFRRCLLAFLALLALGAGACTGVSLLLAPWLSEGDEPVRSNAIVVLGGDPSRALEAAELYHQGYAPRIYLFVAERDPRQRRLDAMGALIFAVVMTVVTWRTCAGAIAAKASNESTMILGFPLWIGYAAMIPGLALTAIAALQTARVAWKEAGRE